MALAYLPKEELIRELEAARSRIVELEREVSDSKRMEKALRATERHLLDQAARVQAILDAAPVVILNAQDREGFEIYANRFARDLGGIPEGANVSRTGPTPETVSHIRIFKDGVEVQTNDMPLQRVASTGRELRNFTYDWVFDNGETHTMFGNIVPIFDSDGKPNGAVAAMMDISERKTIENLALALNDINDVLHSDLETNEIMSRVVKLAARAVSCETSAIALRKGDKWIPSYVYGFPESVLGIQMSDEEEPHAVLAIKTRKPVVIDDAYTDERVNRKHMMKWGVRSVIVIPLVSEGQVIGVLYLNHHKRQRHFGDAYVDFATKFAAVASLAIGKARLLDNLQRELLQRKQTEEALQKAKEEAENQRRRLEAVMEALPVGVSIVDKRGGRVRSNSGFERIWGGTHRMPCPSISSVEDYVAYKAWWADSEKMLKPQEWGAALAIEKGEAVIGQLLEIRRFDGSQAVVINSAAPICDATGEIAGAVVTIQDVTELCQTQDELRESEAKYRQLARSLKKTVKEQVEQLKEAENLASMGRMVAVVAHEIRNPLLNIQLGLDTLRRTLRGENLEVLDEIEYGLHQLNDTVGELLEYSRAARIKPAAHPIGPIIRNALKSLQHKMCDVATDVTLEREEREVVVDAPKMTRVLLNVISNAVDAMPRGGTLRIKSRLSSPRLLTLSISDTGHGMDDGALSRLFQPFHTTKVTGTGLGLGISKKIVEAHGGHIEITSKPAKGTTVRITLPLSK